LRRSPRRRPQLPCRRSRHWQQSPPQPTTDLAGRVFAALLLFGALIAAWWIYRRSVSYDVPGGTPPRGR